MPLSPDVELDSGRCTRSHRPRPSAYTSMSLSTQDLHDKFEPRPDPQKLTGNDERRNVSDNVDYEPHPEKSLKVSQRHEQIIQHITNLYCGSSNEADMQVYAEKAIYDDPYSYCDTRYKIAGKHIFQ